MDALNFEYPDYERLNKGAEGQKRKRIVSVVGRQAARMVKEDEEILKKIKLSPEPKQLLQRKGRLRLQSRRRLIRKKKLLRHLLLPTWKKF
jgi:hypothetical protein